MLKRLFLASIVVAGCGVGLHGQTGTNFSGSWVLEDGIQPSATIPSRLTVDQQIATTDFLGRPLPPAYRNVTVKRHFGSSVQESTDLIGVGSGVTGGIPGSPSTTKTVRSVQWRGDALRIELTNYVSDVVVRQRTEVWRLDDRGRLLITLEIKEAGKAETQTLTYRRDDK